MKIYYKEITKYEKLNRDEIDALLTQIPKTNYNVEEVVDGSTDFDGTTIVLSFKPTKKEIKLDNETIKFNLRPDGLGTMTINVTKMTEATLESNEEDCQESNEEENTNTEKAPAETWVGVQYLRTIHVNAKYKENGKKTWKPVTLCQLLGDEYGVFTYDTDLENLLVGDFLDGFKDKYL